MGATVGELEVVGSAAATHPALALERGVESLVGWPHREADATASIAPRMSIVVRIGRRWEGVASAKPVRG